MIVREILAGMYEEKAYIVMDEASKEGFVVDPGGNEETIFEITNNMGMKIKYILLTHGHIDHVSGTKGLKALTGAPIYINKKDEEMIRKNTMLFGDIPKVDGYLEDGDILKLADKEIKVITTPGHTPGGVCFLIDDILISGDTLFNGSIGRTDFEGGNFTDLISSIKNKLMILDNNIKVYPGHNNPTTIGLEKRQNPYILGDDYVY